MSVIRGPCARPLARSLGRSLARSLDRSRAFVLHMLQRVADSSYRPFSARASAFPLSFFRRVSPERAGCANGRRISRAHANYSFDNVETRPYGDPPLSARSPPLRSPESNSPSREPLWFDSIVRATTSPFLRPLSND